MASRVYSASNKIQFSSTLHHVPLKSVIADRSRLTDASAGVKNPNPLALVARNRVPPPNQGAPTMRHLLIIPLALLFAASAAQAVPTWWWIDGGSDDLWDNVDNWGDTSTPQNNGVPPVTINEDTYITTSDTLSIDPTALIDASVDVEHGTLYVGGWLSAFDTPHGDPHGHFGVLNITGGELHADSPNCRYMRLGTRGARGTVNQSGGLYSTCQAISIAYVGEDAVGFYNLSGGTVTPFGFDVGGQGTGIVDMTGGTINSVASGSPTRSSAIGRGITHPDAERYQPGVGAFLQSGGTFKPENLYIGSSGGSTGVLTVRGESTFEVLNDDDGIADGAVFVGFYGHGSVVQSGGDTDTGSVTLGRRPGGYGMYTMTGGSFTTGTLKVGDAGRGSFVVGGGTVNVTTYTQASGSRLTFIVNDTGSMITPLEVSGTATIPNGSVIDMDLADDKDTGYAVGNYAPVEPECDQELDLIIAAQINGPSTWESVLEPEGYDGLPSDGSVWDLEVVAVGSDDVLRATYVCP
jgi:hypothetical protein